LINEYGKYGNPCQAIVMTSVLDVRRLEGLERDRDRGTLYEAVNTSGGLELARPRRMVRDCELHELQDASASPRALHASEGLLMNDMKLNHEIAGKWHAPRQFSQNDPCPADPAGCRHCLCEPSRVSRMASDREENYVHKVYPQGHAGDSGRRSR